MNIKDTLKKEWPVIVLLTAPFIASYLLWDQVPLEVPTHFNFEGVADDYGPKWMVLLMIPGIGLITYFSLLLLPFIDPKKRIESTQKPIAAIRIVLSVFFAGLYAIMVLTAMGKEMEISTYTTIGVGLLLTVIGNYINTVKPNYFIGIRTPWTLENATVWKKTHRLGSKLWMLGGVIIALSPLFFQSEVSREWVIGFSVVIMAVIPLVYSYFAFQKVDKSNET